MAARESRLNGIVYATLVALAGCNQWSEAPASGKTRAHEQPAPEEDGARDQTSELARLLAVNGHVTILKKTADFTEYSKVLPLARGAGNAVAAQPFTLQEMTSKPGDRAVIVKGVDPDQWLVVMDMAEYFVAGSPDLHQTRASDAPPPALLGHRLAEELGLEVGDRLKLEPPRSPKGWASTGQPKPQELRVRGLFRTDVEDYDRRLLITHLAAGQELANRGDRVTGIELRVERAGQAEQVAQDLQQALGDPYQVLDWCELNHQLLDGECSPKGASSGATPSPFATGPAHEAHRK